MLSEDELKAIRERHVAARLYGCGPSHLDCDAAQLLDALAEARAEAARQTEHSAEMQRTTVNLLAQNKQNQEWTEKLLSATERERDEARREVERLREWANALFGAAQGVLDATQPMDGAFIVPESAMQELWGRWLFAESRRETALTGAGGE